MKSRRVTKLLACVLASSLCAVPVGATVDVTGEGGVTGAKITTDFGIYSPSVTVTVPTEAHIRINPLKVANSTSVNGYEIASNDLQIVNKSVDTVNKTGIPILFTANAKITKKGDSVKVYYDYGKTSPSKYGVSSNSKTKAAYIALQAADNQGAAFTNTPGSGVSDNATYALDTNPVTPQGKNPVTTVGSQLHMPIDAPSINASGALATPYSYGTYAVVGHANENAPWQASDLEIELTYNIKPSTSTGASAPAIALAQQPTSGNALSINATDAVLDGVWPSEFVLHHQEEKIGEWNITDVVEWNRTAADDGWVISISKDDTTLKWYQTEYAAAKGKGSFDLVVSFTDGSVKKLPVNF